MNLLRSISWIPIMLALVSCYITTPINIHATVVPTQSGLLDFGDGGLLSQEPCGPPCYLGVSLDMNAGEAISAIQALGLDSTCDINPSNITCASPPAYISFGPENSNVDLIYFFPDSIAIEGVVEKYGSPTWLAIEAATDELGHSTDDLFMIVFYERISTVLELEHQTQLNSYTLAPETRVKKVIYQEIHLEDQYMKSYWDGYGEYYPP